MNINKLDEEKKEINYDPPKKEVKVKDFISKRIESMKEYRKESGCEDRWKTAEKEYLPWLDANERKTSHLETSDELLGLRTRVVKVGDESEAWRSMNSEPTLFVKINTALSILLDKDPEAWFEPASKKYEATTKIAHSLWKTSWNIDRSKAQLQLFITDLMKYNMAFGKTYPLIIKRNKSVLTSYDTENPDNNVYEDKVITDFNGLHRERLNPWKVWVDEMAKPNNNISLNDWYYECDYDYDQAELEFGAYSNWKYVKQNSQCKEDKESDHKETRGNIVTVGFYENRNKDLYVIYIPNQDLILHYCPLPNDDGKLSLWMANWIVGDPECIYKGVSLWDVISQKKSTYDRFMNMTVDQLTLSIYKMFFYSGTNNLMGDGTIKIAPGVGKQNLGGKVDWMEVPGPGQDAFDGLKMIAGGIDDDSGITPTMQGDITGKTLGEILHAKESALKRLNVPLSNIMYALETEAYISLSWMAQIYSTPEVVEFSDIENLARYEKETGFNKFEMMTNPETGNISATFYPQVPLKLKKDETGNLIETKESRFFQVGNDIPVTDIKWEGVINIIPKSLMSPSEELEKQSKLELFNLLAPLLTGPAELFAKPVKQILKIYDEAPEDWLPGPWIAFLETGQMPAPAVPMFVPQEGTTQPGQSDNSVRESAGTMQEGQKLTNPELQTVVPQGQISTPSTSSMQGGNIGFKGLFK